MKLFPQDNSVVIYETAFEDDDILERSSISKQLSDLVERMEDPIVLALDDIWGSGKTYFLKRWVGAHRKENKGRAVTVYFDAFESDYLSDPLVSIISAVSERIPAEQQSTLEKWKSAATKLAKPSFGIALSLATFGAKQHLDQIGDVIADAASSEATDAAKNLWAAEKERKDAVKSFQDLLIQLTKDEDAPIVIVIDELDRCRPDYALSVLETIKHFFSVPNVHFILGINGTALENSVKARYGADVDAENYLRKFISVSFSLPKTIGAGRDETVVMRYAKQLISDMKLPGNLSNRCANLLSYVALENEVSLRDVGKVFSKIALLPNEATTENLMPGWTDIICVLILSSVLNPKLHKKLVLANSSTNEIRDFLGASNIKTKYKIDGEFNREFDRGLAVWLVLTVYACGVSKSLEIDDEILQRQWDSMGQYFDRFPSLTEIKKIPAEIQRIWIDVFRI
ncbi:MAG: P-loop NTPase fold protein [Ahrensia sp.]